MNSGRDATRRNRNIGTAKQGHGQDNANVIPRLWRNSKLDWSRHDDHVRVDRIVAGRSMPFLVEHTLEDYVHACTVDDIAAVLNLLPSKHVNNQKGIFGIRGIVLRQPTRKETELNPVWARLGYGVEVDVIVGPVVFIEAQTIPQVCKWGKSRTPYFDREFERMSSFASHVMTHKRGDTLEFDIDGIRRVQLFHSLIHEVGHWVDMLTKVERPSNLEDYEFWKGLWNRYFQRPTIEREVFAHRYADETRQQLTERGKIPFDRTLDLEALEENGLRPQDFTLG